VSAKEAYQSEAKFARELYGKAGGRRDRGKERDSSGKGLLNNLEAASPADKQETILKGQMALLQCPSDNFVYGIVAANVFAKDDQTTPGIKEGGGMETSSAAEDLLCISESVRQLTEDGRIDVEVGIGLLQPAQADGLNRGLAADSAAGRGKEVSLKVGQFDRRVVQLHVDDIVLSSVFTR
jgi:hypothetical protein